MSREVEVTGIKMTATVPEDLQIAVGVITDGKTLNANDSYLTGSGASVAPTLDIQWSNTVNISQYYSIGRLIPASSDTGTNIFFTPDANGVGKTEKVNARYIQAAANLSAQNDSGTAGVAARGTYQATLHAKKDSSDTWGAPSGADYVAATGWNNTQDDGYYVDVPVWIRTSSDTDVTLSVDAYVTPAAGIKANDEASIELYRATRVAIIPGELTGGSGTAGVINLIDGSGTGWNGSRTVVNYYGASGTHGIADGAVYAAGTANGQNNGETATNASNWSDIYHAATVYNGFNSVVTIPGSNTGTYGEGKLVWIRVWLEGEDPQCWNQNAGQDWAISVKFTKNN